MSRHILVFVLCFTLGAALTMLVRTLRHHPYGLPAREPMTHATPVTPMAPMTPMTKEAK